MKGTQWVRLGKWCSVIGWALRRWYPQWADWQDGMECVRDVGYPGLTRGRGGKKGHRDSSGPGVCSRACSKKFYGPQNFIIFTSGPIFPHDFPPCRDFLHCNYRIENEFLFETPWPYLATNLRTEFYDLIYAECQSTMYTGEISVQEFLHLIQTRALQFF